MKCNKCGLENPKNSKFCRKCGTNLGVHLTCRQCGTGNPGDSLFCSVCGAKLSGSKKSVKGTQRKCRNCGGFNDLDASVCVVCGEEMIRKPKKDQKQQAGGASYKTIALVIGVIFLVGISVTLAINFTKKENLSNVASTPVQASTSATPVDEAMVIAVAKNFRCACGSCGELPLATCQCDRPSGALEEKGFIREKLAAGFTVEKVIELVDKKYGHRV
jgi:ribosomal protein L40E